MKIKTSKHALSLLRVAIKDRNVTLLAQQTKVRRNTIYRVLQSDGNPRLDIFIRLSKGLGFTIAMRKT